MLAFLYAIVLIALPVFIFQHRASCDGIRICLLSFLLIIASFDDDDAYDDDDDEDGHDDDDE